MTRSIALTFIGALAVFAAALHVPDATADKGLDREFVAQCLIVARDVDPDLADRLVTIREEQGEREFAAALGTARHLVHLTRIREEDPQLYDVKVRSLKAGASVNKLVLQIADARRTGSDEIDIDALESQLDELATKQVALEIAARGMYVNKLQEHLDTLKGQLDQEMSNFNQTVERRRQQLRKRVDLLVGDQSLES